MRAASKYRNNNSKKRKVIFVGGAQYSGTTLLDVIIANDKHGFSCGEVNAFFYPYRSHHYQPDCGCANPDCDLWSYVKKQGEKRLYLSIFERFPNVEFIVDSSKAPFWIASQTKTLKEQNINVYNILIWKTPNEIIHSFNKRGELDQWEKSWINYYRLYFSLIDKWVTVKYADFVKSEDALEHTCRYLDIPYFKNKKEYWHREYHTLFGNTSTKIHLYTKNQQAFKKAEKELVNNTGASKKNIKQNLQSIYYEDHLNPDAIISSNNKVNIMQRLLTEADISQPSSKQLDQRLLESIRFNPIEVKLRSMKQSKSAYQIKKLLTKPKNKRPQSALK